jgi:hypothetical protein
MQIAHTTREALSGARKDSSVNKAGGLWFCDAQEELGFEAAFNLSYPYLRRLL